MRVRRLDENGDIVTRGQMFAFDQNCIAQTICTRLRLFLGEYFRDINDGTPWYQEILGKPENLNAVEAILRNRIVRTEGVIRLLTFDMDFQIDTRVLSVSGSVLTQYGEEEFEVTNG